MNFEKVESTLFLPGSLPLPSDTNFLESISKSVIQPNLADNALDLSSLVDRLNKERTPLLCGYSMGGRVLLSLLESLAYTPELVVILASALPLEGHEQRAQRQKLDSERSCQIKLDFKQFLEKWYAGNMWALNQMERTKLVQEYLNIYHSQALRNDLSVLFDKFSPAKFPSSWDPNLIIQKKFRGIYISGELDLKYCDEGRKFTTRFSSFRHLIIPSVGHKLLFKKQDQDLIIREIQLALTSKTL